MLAKKHPDTGPQCDDRLELTCRKCGAHRRLKGIELQGRKDKAHLRLGEVELLAKCRQSGGADAMRLAMRRKTPPASSVALLRVAFTKLLEC